MDSARSTGKLSESEKEFKKMARLEKLIQADHLMVITTRTAVDATVWRRYVQAHWSKLVWKNSRIVALAGVHGKVNGEISRNDANFVRWNENQVKKLKRDNAQDIRDLNVQIDVVDVADYRDKEVLDEEALVDIIKTMSPTVIVLTFCFTDKSVLNDIFAKAGVLSAMFVDSRREKVSPLAEQQPNGIIRHV